MPPHGTSDFDLSGCLLLRSGIKSANEFRTFELYIKLANEFRTIELYIYIFEGSSSCSVPQAILNPKKTRLTVLLGTGRVS